MKVFTIGYGGIEPSTFVQTLVDQSIRSVVDIRIWPMRANMGAYTMARSSDKGIYALLARAGISYFSFLELGNPFKDLSDWKSKYRRLIESAGTLVIERLTDIPAPLCLLCAEKRPEDCHRSILAEFLRQCGHEVHHIET
jgi:uncharacterized protein (DUF488 family)